ncbi:hypothetical protein AVEN_145198-1 [Araneus ventricosus]|uniref:Uncharacterized protein n=1 Tax=Araneus ventricosus TaxID=182803 RepID=A0A4Y2Q759_ARAVE|nr:hypothetical protein AVEN_145198-1 [Araneus ventricosus]
MASYGLVNVLHDILNAFTMAPLDLSAKPSRSLPNGPMAGIPSACSKASSVFKRVHLAEKPCRNTLDGFHTFRLYDPFATGFNILSTDDSRSVRPMGIIKAATTPKIPSCLVNIVCKG